MPTIINPVASGRLFRIEAVQAEANPSKTAQLFVRPRNTAGLDTTGTPWPRDGRWDFSKSGSVAIFGGRQNSGLPATGSIEAINIEPDTTVAFLTLPVILSPGDEMNVGSGTLNEAMGATFKWRERPARPEELAI
jgi:hypothetical protein